MNKNNLLSICTFVLLLTLVFTAAVPAQGAQQAATPPTYQWHTFFGSSSGTFAVSAAIDPQGNTFVLGSSYDAWEGPGGQKPINSYPIGSNPNALFVMKLNSAGQYLWHTFLGGDGMVMPTKILIGSDANLYITGSTYIGWQVGGADPLHAYNPDLDLFAVSLTKDGIYRWLTFFGGGGSFIGSYGNDLALDSSNNLYITGSSKPGWKGDTGQDPLELFNGTTNAANLYVLKLNSAGKYLWHIFFGPGDNHYAEGNGIAVDATGNAVFVAGTSNDQFLGHNHHTPLHNFYFSDGSNQNLFAMRLTKDGAYVWHTFYGAAGKHWTPGLALDQNSNLYLSAWALNAGWMGDQNASPLQPFTGTDSTVVLKLNSAGVYLWHTFYPAVTPSPAAVDANGDLFFTGMGSSSWLGDGGAQPLSPFVGNDDVCLFKLSKNGTYLWHTFYGSTEDEAGLGVTTASGGVVEIVGRGRMDFKVAGTNPLHAYTGAGNRDNLLVLKLVDAGSVPPVLSKKIYLPSLKH